MNDPICEEMHIDTFLAVTEVKPIEPKRPRITVERKEQIGRELIECLDDELYPELWDIFDEEDKLSSEEKVKRIDKHLNALYKKKTLTSDENRIRQIEDAIEYYLDNKISVEFYDKKVPIDVRIERINQSLNLLGAKEERLVRKINPRILPPTIKAIKKEELENLEISLSNKIHEIDHQRYQLEMQREYLLSQKENIEERGKGR